MRRHFGPPRHEPRVAVFDRRQQPSAKHTRFLLDGRFTTKNRPINHRTMPIESFSPGPKPNTVRTKSGKVQQVPEGWILLPPGDAGLTRRVKAAGEFWLVEEQVKNRMYSRGIWAPRDTIERIQQELAKERATPGYSKRREADAKRRETKQAEYVEDFEAAVLAFLGFHERHREISIKLAKVVAQHATPVGSGTVARTQRISIVRRAEAAVIAWLRHQTTGYDNMQIPRVKGERREVRRMLAQRSRELLEAYRQGAQVVDGCPLALALSRLAGS